ncbi:molecular chaperone HtpG [Erysipelothrix urinaevulpis]|uniref:molecular chaperone HtpG n=1 Tax=Erysipelothrix urinaevulpis TaxID=2683717 RepID=UPI0013581FAE|nr:molecular chaperone HtpG [Erysipelothrix urinaevulpis]
MTRKKQFKAESKRLLDLMINSIYTNKEIFLRELLSNASDASDKLYFKSLQDTDIKISKNDLQIRVDVDTENRQLIIHDRGIGMNKEELETYLGTIAKSDSHAFKEALSDDEANPVDIIGQFGVGFYSAFMVSSKIEVISKAYGHNDAYRFESNGLDGYRISEAEREHHGTTIICTIKESTDEEDYDQFLEPFTLTSLIKTYSDYIPYPIIMKTEEDKEETINSMVPLWKRSKSDVSKEQLNDFYKEKFNDFEDPLKTIQMKVEGVPSFDALLYIPKHVPHNFYSTVYEPGLQLYSRGVFIMDRNKDLIPEHFRFVQGLVDSPDLSLNISREILQHDRQLKVISNRIERRIQRELETMMKNDRDEYEKLWTNFGSSIKYGIYSSFGMNKEKLQDLLLFNSSTTNQLTSLSEYVERMKENQEEIYFISGESIAKCEISPQAEFVRSKGYEVLYLIDEIDEFVLQVMMNYDEKNFKSVNQGDLDLIDDETKEAIEKKTESSKDLLSSLKEHLSHKVDDVKLSSRLVSHPVCLVSDEGLSFEMEKVLNALPENDETMKAQRILEINPDHELLQALNSMYEKNPDTLKDYADILYDQACLIEGLPIEDPVEFSKKIANLMIETSK